MPLAVKNNRVRDFVLFETPHMTVKKSSPPQAPSASLAIIDFLTNVDATLFQANQFPA